MVYIVSSVLPREKYKSVLKHQAIKRILEATMPTLSIVSSSTSYSSLTSSVASIPRNCNATNRFRCQKHAETATYQHKEEEESSATRKKLCSQDYDVIITVGSGEVRQEFECYKVILCYASDVFDNMFCHSMRERNTSRIELPDKDPKEWKIFYKFIDPTSARSAKITKSNALSLVPWFHEYHLISLLHECDAMISSSSFLATYLNLSKRVLKTFWSNKKYLPAQERIVVAEKLLDLMICCDQYQLDKSMPKIILYVSWLMNDGLECLLRSNRLLKCFVKLYVDHQKDLRRFKGSTLFTDIVRDGVDWDNIYFTRMIEAKVENFILRNQRSNPANQGNSMYIK